jgi:alginate O-acetyltransferase complex protein AlgI
MIFTTWLYATLLIGSVILYWLIPRTWRRWLLLVVGAVFYANSSVPYLGLVISLAAVTYVTAWFLQRMPADTPEQQKRRKWVFVAGIVLNAGILAFFKYTRMAVATYNDVALAFGGERLPIPEIMVPLAISFFVFEFIHFLSEVYLRKVEQLGKLDFAVFSLFFPSLVAGPIKRYQPFAKEGTDIATGRQPFDPALFAEGVERIIWGLGKKLLIADLVGRFSDVLLNPYAHSDGAIWLGVYAYAIKIYADFSGYSDIAIGSGMLFGYRLPENFDWPYLRRNISEFWRYWHMSLSSWIRDYLFIPLGGSRVGTARTLFNLTLMMAISGLWHGAGWNFVLWGLWHGAGLVVLNLWRKLVKDRIPASPWVQKPLTVVSTLVTFQFVCLGWVLFASPDAETAFYSFRRMFGG